MVLYYAMGGGLGHLTRGIAFLNTLSLTEGAAIISSSSYADDPRVKTGLRVIRPPASLEDDAAEFGLWIRQTITREKPDKVVIDSFPAGILGELSGLDQGLRFELWHVARMLKWSNYSNRLGGRPLPHFDVIWEAEPLHDDHNEALRPHAREVRHIELSDPAAKPGTLHIDPPYWLVVHSGPPDEVADLLQYAVEMREAEDAGMRIILVSPARPAVTAPSISMIDIYPAWPLFGSADRIITAAGFNIMRQTTPYRDRHRFIPFPRALDDQYTRAVRAREAEQKRL